MQLESAVKFDYYDLKLQTPRFIPKQQMMPFTIKKYEETKNSVGNVKEENEVVDNKLNSRSQETENPQEFQFIL